ncbi:hypothetical protein [Micromonospora sp. S4605]|uniref:hypothetical protein n=1 Tax=Micromonospora sp. S4605 TaxID=1420897 RepID=UPI001E39339F|nr:hypothetical protein [Micromonospora sp. S4605]
MSRQFGELAPGVRGVFAPAAEQGEALHKLDYRDAGPKPDTTGRTTTALALNAAHLARLLAEQPYPPPDAKNAGVGPSREPA